VPLSPDSRTFQIKKWDGQTWTTLGPHTAAGNQEEMAPYLALSQSNVLHMAFIKHTLWNGDSIIVMKWQGGAWARVGNAPADTGASVTNWPRLALQGETPYLAWIEMDQRGNLYPPRNSLFLKHFTGTGWKTDSLAGRDFFNKFASAGAQVMSADVAVGPDQAVYLASDEFITDDATCTPNWVFVMKRDSGSVVWQRLGGALNSDSLNRWATYPSISFVGNNPAVAFNERTESGLNQVFVKAWNGVSWQGMGGSLNVNGDSGFAYHPVLKNFQGVLYVAFCEFRKGDRVKTYLKRWNGSGWDAAAGPLNVDGVNGSAADPSIALVGQKCYLAWSEQTFPGFRQVYAALADSLASGTHSGKTPSTANPLSLSPNPFHSSSGLAIKLAGDLRAQRNVSLKIFDLNGGLVKVFDVAGRQKLHWNPGAFSAGIYLIKLEARGQSWTRQALLLK
jgi:hypothetical protein